MKKSEVSKKRKALPEWKDLDRKEALHELKNFF
jgi:hypothetical protein